MSSSSSTPPIHSLAQSPSFFLYFFLLSASVSPFVLVSQPPSSSSSHPRLQPILHRNSRSRRNPSTAVKLRLVMYARWGQENENAVPQRRPCEGAFLATLPGRDMLTPVCLLGMSSSFSPSMQLEIFLLSFTRGWISDTSGLLASKCEQEDLLLPSRENKWEFTKESINILTDVNFVPSSVKNNQTSLQLERQIAELSECWRE